MTQSKAMGFFVAVLIFLTGDPVFSQSHEAEEKLACLMISHADFPKRYAVQCDFEFHFNNDEGLVLYRSSQHFAWDSESRTARAIANQQKFLDFAPQEVMDLNIWKTENGVEWSPGVHGVQWINDGHKLLPIFDPKNVVVSRPEVMDETIGGKKTITSILEGRECVESFEKNGVFISKWALREVVGLNRITVLKHRGGKPGPPEEILSLQSIKGGWTPEKDKETALSHPVRRIIDWWQASDTVWVPKKVRIIARIKKDMDCEASFVMRWAFGDAVSDSVFKDPRGKKPEDLLSRIKYEEFPSIPVSEK